MRETFWYFLKLGWLAFGGPVGQIGLMHLQVIERQKWIDEDEFVGALNFCHVLPGPEALQLAIYIGWKKGGYLAGALAGLLFLLPGFILTEGDVHSLIAPQLVLNLGLSSRWEAVFDGAGVFPLDAEPGSPRFRFEETGLSLKGVLREGSLQAGSGPSIGTEVGVLLPTFHGQPGTGASAAMIVSQRWEVLAVHLNGLAERTRAKNLGWFGGLIVEGPDRWFVRPVGEVLVEGESGGNPRSASGLVGAVWRVHDAFSLDLAFRVARIGDLSVYEGRLGFTWDIGLWRKG
jgi:hypothetical protein